MTEEQMTEEAKFQARVDQYKEILSRGWLMSDDEGYASSGAWPKGDAKDWAAARQFLCEQGWKIEPFICRGAQGPIFSWILVGKPEEALKAEPRHVNKAIRELVRAEAERRSLGPDAQSEEEAMDNGFGD